MYDEALQMKGGKSVWGAGLGWSGSVGLGRGHNALCAYMCL